MIFQVAQLHLALQTMQEQSAKNEMPKSLERQALETLSEERLQHEEQGSTASEPHRAQAMQDTSAPGDPMIPLFSKFAQMNQKLQIF
jgi:hypothetical protein